MQINLSGLKHFKKASFASLIMILLIFMFLMALLPFSTANGGASTMEAPGPGTVPTIDGNWTGTEWDDAPQYNITGLGGTGYIQVKHNNTHLFIIIDSVWDTAHDPIMGSYEGTYVAFDTAHNHTSVPQTDDYLFFCGFSTWNFAWNGTGIRWKPLYGTGFVGEQALGTSPNSGTPHRIDEMAINLTYVGSLGSTSGFYVIVRDDGSDPDGYGSNDPPTAWVEWPTGAGGDPRGWPMFPDYIDPCPAPSAWGHLTLLQRPTAAFTWNPPNPDVGDIVSFNATTSYDLDGTIANYTWNFGDGNITTVSTPLINHTFSAPGSYAVNLTVTDNDGLNGSVVDTVNVGVVAAFTFSPHDPNVDDVVIFNATDSYSPGGNITSYYWDFGDSFNGTDMIINHTFPTGGSYAVNLTVTDNFTRMAWVVHTVNVGAPVANFTFWPSKPNKMDAVIFNATASSDPDGIANYAWNWGDTSSNVTTNPIITHIFSANRSYTVNLTVTDNTGLKAWVVDTVNVYASREAHFWFSPPTPNVGDVVTFNASLSKDPSGSIVNYTWDFNDGSSIITVNTTVITHIFSASGSYNVNLTITDNDGLKSWDVNTVNVGIPPFQATAPFSPIIPSIDGIWNPGEWDDANEYEVTGPGGTSYLRIKHNSTHLHILIDSPWDTTNATGVAFENTFVAFDTGHDKSTVGPQLDDYLFNNGYSVWNFAWKGNGIKWTSFSSTDINYTGMGYNAWQGRGSSPKNATMHRIDEFRIPLDFVGNSTSGFYIMVVDGNSDPDGWGDNLPPTAWVEWPTGAGGDPRGWPLSPGYIEPCPHPDKWGYLILETGVKSFSNVTLDISLSSITLGESVTISGTVSNSTWTIAGVEVTIQYRLIGTTAWTNATTITTNSTGSYTYAWTPKKAGTYEIKASWAGDADNYGAESEVKTLEVASKPFPILEIVAGLAVVVVVVAVAVYLLKVRKPKR